MFLRICHDGSIPNINEIDDDNRQEYEGKLERNNIRENKVSIKILVSGFCFLA